MPRKSISVIKKMQVLTDILCDCCGDSTKGEYSGEFDKATLEAEFSEGRHAGDKFVIDLCSGCFDKFMEWFLITEKGTCYYESQISGNEASIDDIRAFYAASKEARENGQLEEFNSEFE